MAIRAIMVSSRRARVEASKASIPAKLGQPYTVSERHHYATQVNQTLALGLGSGFIHGFSFTFML